MLAEGTSFRPRVGECAEAYWRIRAWCEQHGFSFSDIFNALLIPVSFHLANHTELDKEKGLAWCDLTVGTIPILHCLGGRLYKARADHANLEEIEERIKYWQKRNQEKPEHVDTFLKQLVLKK